MLGLVWSPIFALDAAMICQGTDAHAHLHHSLRMALLAPMLWAGLRCGPAVVLAGMAVRETGAIDANFAALGDYRQRLSSEDDGPARVHGGSSGRHGAYCRSLAPSIEPMDRATPPFRLGRPSGCCDLRGRLACPSGNQNPRPALGA